MIYFISSERSCDDSGRLNGCARIGSYFFEQLDCLNMWKLRYITSQAKLALLWIHNNIFYKLMLQNQIFYKMECRKKNYQSLKVIPHYIAILKTITICQTVFAYLFFFVMIYLFTAYLLRIYYEDCKCISKQVYFIILFFYIILWKQLICFEVSSQQNQNSFWIKLRIKDKIISIHYLQFVLQLLQLTLLCKHIDVQKIKSIKKITGLKQYN